MKFRVLIAASGSGGHLLPALAIATALKEKGAHVEFVGSGRPLEEKIIGAAHIKRHVIHTVGLKSRGLKGAIEFALSLPRALLETHKIITSLRPNVVVGVGGYASVLPVLCAALRRIPTWVHEAELRAGMANGLLSFVASRVSLAFRDAKLPCMKRAIYTGHPIRKELRSIVKVFPDSPKHILIMGGSQGAKSIDGAAARLAEYAKTQALEIVHQVRPENVELVASTYVKAGCNATVLPFIDDMANAYQKADLIICRSGAGTVMEIEALGIPAIFVPYPYAQGDHQTANARTLADKGKALIVLEGPEFEQRLVVALSQLCTPDAYQKTLQQPVERRSLTAADTIASKVYALIAP